MTFQDRINYLFEINHSKKAKHLAEFLKVSRGAVSEWRRGNVKSVTAVNAVKMAEFFNVSPEWLVNGKERNVDPVCDDKPMFYSELTTEQKHIVDQLVYGLHKLNNGTGKHTDEAVKEAHHKVD